MARMRQQNQRTQARNSYENRSRRERDSRYGVIDEGPLFNARISHEVGDEDHWQARQYLEQHRFENEVTGPDVDPRYYGGASYYNQMRDTSGYENNGGLGGPLAQRYAQSHAGKGPKGYKRSDEHIYEEVCERLSQDPDIDASEIEVEVQDGIVTLSGMVEDRRFKRMVEDVVEDCRGVRDVKNDLQLGSIHGFPASTPETIMRSSKKMPASIR